MSAEVEVDVVYVRSRGTTWGQIDELAQLTARLLGAGPPHLIDDTGDVSRWRKLMAHAPRTRSRSRVALLIVGNPAQLSQATTLRHWFPGYAQVAAWVIDSFWTDWVARIASVRWPRHFDQMFITDGDLVEDWRGLTHAQVTWVPWGTDTLAVGDVAGPRAVDVQRVGRQPAAWDDDDRLVSMARARALVALGRPPLAPDGLSNQQVVREALLNAKVTLAFNNIVNPEPYTHPKRQYLTGRWADALASGCIVAGAVPECRSTSELLWEGATVEVDPFDLEHGLDQLLDVIGSWNPEKALYNHRQARLRLDWRHRIARICAAMQIPQPAVLAAELERLRSE